MVLLNIYIRHSNLFYRNAIDSPLTAIWMWFCPGNMMSTSEFDGTGKVCSIWTNCDCVYFFDIEPLFWCNGTASLVVGAWSKTHNKISTKKWTITFCSYATNFACFIKFWSAHHVHKRIWHPFIGERRRFVICNIFFAITNIHVPITFIYQSYN